MGSGSLKSLYQGLVSEPASTVIRGQDQVSSVSNRLKKKDSPTELFFTGFKGKDVAVGMILADVKIRAPDGLEPDCVLPALITCWFFRHGYLLMESFCRYILCQSTVPVSGKHPDKFQTG
jgi:hypothetical protein